MVLNQKRGSGSREEQTRAGWGTIGIHRFLELGNFFIGIAELLGVRGRVLGFPGS